MLYQNSTYSKTLIILLLLLISIDLAGLGISLHDIFYLKRIENGTEVPESLHSFFILKNQIEYRASTILYLIFAAVFLTWFFRAYKNVYSQTEEEAPFKPLIVPFSFLIPLFNLYGPYQIMKFIWQENKVTEKQKKTDGYKIINLWWFLSLLTFFYSRICSGKYRQAEYADEYLTATYFYILLYCISIHLSIVTIQIIRAINQAEKTTGEKQIH